MTALFVPLDGRLTSQNILTGPLDGTEVMYIVSPGNASEGNSYQVSLDVLSGFFGLGGITTIITSGADIGSPYDVLTNQSRILFNKTVGVASYVTFPLASTMVSSSVLIKDIKGDALTNNITMNFTGGELCDGLTSVIINDDYGWTTINPLPGGGGWFQT